MYHIKKPIKNISSETGFLLQTLTVSSEPEKVPTFGTLLQHYFLHGKEIEFYVIPEI